MVNKDPGKYTNPAGFYIHLVEENTPIPIGFETNSQRKAREETERRRDAERRAQQELEYDYEDYRNAEIDRYIAMPGQALAYLTGKREILRLRAQAIGQLGHAFSLPDFHAAVLDQGSLPMPVLERAITDWVSQAGPAGTNQAP